MSYITCRKAINFDLDTKKLKKYYPGKSYRHAYADIKNFMERKGFEHRQWSGYCSKDKMSTQDITMLTKVLIKSFPWLKKCINKFDVTEIGQQHDLSYLITGKSHKQVQKIEKQAEKSAYMPRSKLEAQANKLHNAQRNTPTKTKSKNNEIE